MEIADQVRSPLSRKAVCVVILLAATAVVAPFLLRGYKHGHDLEFHVSSWLEFSRQWHQGVVHPRWAELANFGYGEPRFVFYPPLSLYLGGLLTTLFPYRMIVGAYVWLVLVLAGFSFFYLCLQFFDTRSSLFGAAVYIINPYHLLQIYARSSFAELLISASFPLLLLAAYRLDGRGRRRIAAAALMIAVIALTNIPGAVVVAYSATAFVMILSVMRRSRARLPVSFVIAGLLGAGLAGFYLLPAWFEQSWAHTSRVRLIVPMDEFIQFNSVRTNHFQLALAGILIGQVVAAGLAWAISRRMKPQDAFWAFAVVLSASIIMTLPVSAGVWRIAPLLRYVQFPWRWLGPMSLAMSFFVAGALHQSSKGLLLASGVCALCLAMIPMSFMLARKTNYLSELSTSFLEDRGYPGNGEYLPRDLNQSTVTPGDPGASEISPEVAGMTPTKGEGSPAPQTVASKIAITRWTAEARDIIVDASHPVWIRIRLFRFPGWYAYVDGNPIDPIPTDSRGAIVLPAPAGRSHLEVVYKGTPDQTWGTVLSSSFFMLLLWIFRKSI